MRDFADLSLAAHSFLLAGSFLPVPIFDGGVILKWSLVAAGQTPPQADRSVRRVDLGLGAALLGLGALLGFSRQRKQVHLRQQVTQRRLAGGLLAAAGAACLAVAFGWLK